MNLTPTRLLAAALLASLLIEGSGLAGLTPLNGTFTYQGRLRAGGNDADGVHDFRFTLWNAPAGGAQVAPLFSADNVSVTDGIFTATINFGLFLAAFGDFQRWMEISVKTDASAVYTTLTPRQAITPAPQALFALGAGIAHNVVDGGLPDSYAEPIEFKNLGNQYSGANLNLFGAVGPPTVQLNGDVFGFGGQLVLAEENGAVHTILEPDFSGSGGFLSVSAGPSGGFVGVEGNADGTGNPVLTIAGVSQVMQFNTITPGDASVVLPPNSLAAAEILDEPGVANIHSAAVALGPAPALSALASRTITVPAAGYVLVLAQGDLALFHTAGLAMDCTYGVSAASGSLPLDQDVQTQIPPALPSGTYDFSASAHGLFQVNAAGSFTFFFVANRTNNTDTATMFDIQLTCIYFPTAYGNIVSNDPEMAGGIAGGPAATDPNNGALMRSPLTEADIAAEQREAAAWHAARQDAELKAMQAEIAALQQRLDRVLAQQSAGRR